MEGAPKPEVTVYSKESCVQCTATYRRLDKDGVPYEVQMLEDNPELIEQFKAEGLMQAPIVEANGERWSGFRPDKLGALAINLVNKLPE